MTDAASPPPPFLMARATALLAARADCELDRIDLDEASLSIEFMLLALDLSGSFLVLMSIILFLLLSSA